MRRKLLIGLMLALGALSACTKKDDLSGKKIANIPLSDDVKTFDPAQASDTVTHTVMPLVLETLYQYAYLKTPLTLEPQLADGMPQVSSDGLTYTIKIKKGVRFQDDPVFPDGKGRELKAQDFLYGWKRHYVTKVRSTGSWIFDDKIAGLDDFRKKMASAPADKVEETLATPVEGFKALDDYTLQIKLVRKYPQLLHVLAMSYSSPLPKELTDKYGHDGLTEKMIGTGPYVLKSLVRGSRIALDKNPNYRDEKYPSEGDDEAKAAGMLAQAGQKLPFLDGISFRIYKEDQPQWLAFMKGDIDVSGIPKDNYGSAIAGSELTPELKKKGIVLRKIRDMAIWYLNFNMKDKLVGSNADLRRAIVRTIDREKWIDLFLNGRGIKATSMVPEGIAGHTGRKELIGDYNLEEAKHFLAKAGYPGGKGLPVLKLDLRGSSTSQRQQAEFIASSVARIGIKMDVISNTFPAYLAKQNNGNLQFFLGGWAADYPDAENFVQLGYGKNVSPGPNAANWVNPEFDKLYEKIAGMSPSPERTELIRKAEDILFGEAVWSMLHYPILYSLNHQWTKNYRNNRMIWDRLKYIDIDPEQKRKALKEAF